MNSPIVSDVTAFDVRGDWGRLHLGDSANVLKSLQDNSVDAIVTDPPAGIAFMGKKWDADKGGRLAWIEWLAEILRECRRVLKPGGHALVWALPRTSHWTATALEEAGFELRERITHIFSTGFPKNHDVSKAIDKAAGAVREVVGKKSLSGNAAYIAGETNALYSSTERAHGRDLTTGKKEIDLTAPATPDAQRYEGFGTALKPALEDWVLCRKPLPHCDKVVILLKEIATTIFQEEVWCQRFNVSANVVEMALMFSLQLFEKGEESSAQGSARTKGSEKTGPVPLVEKSSMPACLPSREGTPPIVQKNAAILREDARERRTETGEVADLPEGTDTSSLEMNQVSMFWSIVFSWRSILGDLFNLAKTCTTEMKIPLTTELRTLNFALIQATSEIITRNKETQVNGEWLSVQHVDLLLKSALTKLLLGAETTVQESVSIKHGESKETPRTSVNKPAVEDYFLARKPLVGTVAANVLEWGCGALNINGSRIPLQGEESPSVQRRKRAAPGISVGASGWETPARPPSYNAPHHGEQLGRWPANLILSHSPDCSEDACVDGCPVRILGEQSGECKSSGGGMRDWVASPPWGGKTAPNKTASCGLGDTGTAARYFLNLRPDPPFFYCPKASVRDRNEGLAEFPDVLPHEITGRGRGSAGQMTPYAGASGDSPRKNTHPTVKSTKLMAYLCRLVTPPGGLILDPFLGSGSTGVAALREGFRFVGIEKEEEYFEIAKARIENEAPDEETETTEEQGPWKQLEMF